MPENIARAAFRNLLAGAPNWYKLALVGCLAANPVLLVAAGPFVAGWVLVAEFIFTLAMALRCHPLPAGGLLALEAVLLGLTGPGSVYRETLANFPVILLLLFMVAGVWFMQELLRFLFTRILLSVRSKTALSFAFCLCGAALSAFLDALTVVAVIAAVAHGFYAAYHSHASSGRARGLSDDGAVDDTHREDLRRFRGFLRNLLVHGAVGTALGGVTTLVGEPQNLLIATEMGWGFAEFFVRVAPVSLPVLAVGLLTCVAVEKARVFGYGVELPASVREVLVLEAARQDAGLDVKAKARLVVQAIAGIWLVAALSLHLAEVGLIGLSVVVLLTALLGVTDERRMGHAFSEAMPFTALLVVFFAVVAVIHDQHLFSPVIRYVLGLTGRVQLVAYYLANGLLSMISDNVFVATVYISETKQAFLSGAAGLSREQFNLLGVAINTGTNIPSVATPNGQAAFLFLLTSGVAQALRLSYGRMVRLALPYTVSMTFCGLVATWLMG